MMERGLSVDHTTIYRWVMIYAPEIGVCLAEEKFWSVEDFLIPTVPLLIIGH